MSATLHLMADHEYEVDSDQVLKLATMSRCSAYDCEFVALAQELGTTLLTVDKQLLRDFPQVTTSLSAFVTGGQEDG